MKLKLPLTVNERCILIEDTCIKLLLRFARATILRDNLTCHKADIGTRGLSNN